MNQKTAKLLKKVANQRRERSRALIKWWNALTRAQRAAERVRIREEVS
jgi:hypothetical protein